ncbi:MAG: DUF481 domain-containing protein [Candidatus Omnitrophica bacterium]|nr:DUF481 domain-containing protein [Candidatus Omnitrophota bacterium]
MKELNPKVLIFLALMVAVGLDCAYADTQSAWKQEISLGYSQKTGNTQNSQLSGTYQGLRATESEEITLKASTLYSSQKKKMDGQKHTGSARYAPNLADTDWFVFAMTEAEHDRFAAIDYRLVPAVGAGYWFSNTRDWKASAELGLGYEYVKYTDNSDEDNMAVIPRAYFEKAVFEKARISEELIIYPNLKNGQKYRARSETKFTNPLSEEMSMRVSFIDEFNTDPLGSAKKNDTQLLLSLVYTF